MLENEYLETIKKLAKGYEVEEIDTIIEQDKTKTKKKIIKRTRHIPANLEAIKLLMNKNKTPTTIKEQWNLLCK